MKMIFLDLETGGLKPTDPIVQMSWIIRVDGEEYPYEVYIRADRADCDPVALEITGIDPEDECAMEEDYAITMLIQSMEEHLDLNNPKDKFYLVGYNSHAFDCKFLRALFVRNYRRYNDYFWNPSIDVMLIAAGFCVGQRERLGDFKQTTVAKALGIEVDENKLHDSTYDVLLAKDIYDVLAQEMIA